MVEAISNLDRYKLSGTGASEQHAKALLDTIDTIIDSANASRWRYDGELWVAPDGDGDDDADGSEDHPLSTLYGLSQRLPLQGKVLVHLMPGIHTLPDRAAVDSKTLIGNYGEVEITSDVVDIADFLVDSVDNNVITVQGDPGWGTNDHRGKLLYYRIWGIYDYWFYILSNTSNTLTIAIAFDNVSGGTIPTPVHDEAMKIQGNSATIRCSETNVNNHNNPIRTFGNVTFSHVDFDVATNGSRIPIIEGDLDTNLILRHCHFLGYNRTNTAVFPRGTCDASLCWFEDCKKAIQSAYAVRVSNIVLKNCEASFHMQAAVITVFGNMFMIDTYALYLCAEGGHVLDYTVFLWAEGGGRYAQSDAYGKYEKRGSTLKGWPDGVHDTLSYVMTCIGGSSTFILAYSESCALYASSSFFYLMGNAVTLADYIAGTDADSIAAEAWLDKHGTRISEYY